MELPLQCGHLLQFWLSFIPTVPKKSLEPSLTGQGRSAVKIPATGRARRHTPMVAAAERAGGHSIGSGGREKMRGPMFK